MARVLGPFFFLFRFSSIHPYKKKSARRTKSADQWHKATALINQSAERPELSDTSSEISSDGVHAVIEENKGKHNIMPLTY